MTSVAIASGAKGDSTILKLGGSSNSVLRNIYIVGKNSYLATEDFVSSIIPPTAINYRGNPVGLSKYYIMNILVVPNQYGIANC